MTENEIMKLIDIVVKICDITTSDDSSSEDSSSEDSSSDSSSSEDSSSEDEKEYKFEEQIDSFNEDEFKIHMGLKKETANFLIERYKKEFLEKEQNVGIPQLSGKVSVYIYLWYISNSVTFGQLGILFGIKKSTVSQVIRRVVRYLVSISHEFIRWPKGAELVDNCKKFEQKEGIPGVVGAIDCTHITINAPNTDKESYLNLKKNYSLVLQEL